MIARIVLTAFLIVLAGTATAHQKRVGGIEVIQSWARASAGAGKTGAVYLTLLNRGRDADRLVAVATPVARKAAIHETVTEGGVMKMRPLDALPLPAHQSVKLAPGGVHVMLMGLAAPLEEGGRFPLTLRFARAEPVTVDVVVRGPGAMSAGGD